jgi:hypothetical protein
MSFSNLDRMFLQPHSKSQSGLAKRGLSLQGSDSRSTTPGDAVRMVIQGSGITSKGPLA